AAGVFLRGDLATVAYTTVRGDTVEMLTGGIYRFNGESIAAEGIGWDLVTLLGVVPALLVSLPGLRRGSTRAVLFVIGLLAYFSYQYAEYAMALAYGPLFLVYVATFALSLSALGLILGGLDLERIAASVDERFPRRGATGFGILMAVLLTGMWLPLVARSATAASVPELNGGTTLVVQAFDLGFLVPLGLLTAVAAWRRLAVGYVLAPLVLVKGAAMGAAIAAMLVVEAIVTGVVQPVPIAVFAGVSVVSIVIGVRVFASVGVLPHLAGTPTTGSMAHRVATG
ncbi:MAG TPA: hypothetical protein VF119_01875, partial [Candidatus Limnocylindrales bacterium]